ncbi:MAG: ABC transporter ATP-binding protein [Eubacteriales bacterium]|nr:ABC transporter ATP-binding protein [Eubacteriales bacterium]
MLLEVNNVSGGYGHKKIIKNVSCKADKGEILCLLGPNGCGKTTLFRMILGILPLSSGNIMLDGKDLSSLSQRERANLIAYIPQSHTPSFSYSVLDVVLMGRAAFISSLKTPGSKDMEAAKNALNLLHILHLADRKYTDLSGGQRQLVLIARAICQSSKILVLDEPAASLDYANQQLLINVISDLAKKGFCIIMSTHSPEHPASIGDKTLLLKEGQVAAFGSSDEVITNDNLKMVYGIEIDVVNVTDRYGNKRTICLPVQKTSKLS